MEASNIEKLKKEFETELSKHLDLIDINQFKFQTIPTVYDYLTNLYQAGIKSTELGKYEQVS